MTKRIQGFINIHQPAGADGHPEGAPRVVHWNGTEIPGERRRHDRGIGITQLSQWWMDYHDYIWLYMIIHDYIWLYMIKMKWLNCLNGDGFDILWFCLMFWRFCLRPVAASVVWLKASGRAAVPNDTGEALVLLDYGIYHGWINYVTLGVYWW